MCLDRWGACRLVGLLVYVVRDADYMGDRCEVDDDWNEVYVMIRARDHTAVCCSGGGRRKLLVLGSLFETLAPPLPTFRSSWPHLGSIRGQGGNQAEPRSYFGKTSGRRWYPRTIVFDDFSYTKVAQRLVWDGSGAGLGQVLKNTSKIDEFPTPPNPLD